jgi:DNA-binding transcriptional LysR family regulator
VKAHAAPATVLELLDHPLIAFDKRPSIRRPVNVGVDIDRSQLAFRCDSDLGQWAALRAGFGVGFCQVPIARRERLTAILPGLVGFEMGIWVVMHKDLRSSRRARLLFDHLARGLEAHVAMGSG